MTYVTEQSSAELREHMRRLRQCVGWHEPLADRLFKEIEDQDERIAKLEAALRWALGEAPDNNGVWFGEGDGFRQKPYWWRNHLREIAGLDEQSAPGGNNGPRD